MSVSISYAGTDELVITAIAAKADLIAPAVVAKLDELDAETVGYIVSQELHGQVLKQRSGKLAGSIRALPAVREGTSIIGKVEGAGGPAWYGALFERGAGTVEIVPVHAKALRFVADDGSVVYCKRVRVNFNRPFMGPGLIHMTPQYVSGIEETIGEVLGG